MKDTIVIDIDGTLSDCSERQHLVMGKKPDYDAFHARLASDRVNDWCTIIAAAISLYGSTRGLPGLYQIVLVSARPRSTNEATIKWLQENQVVFAACYLLRKEDDSTPSRELKREWLKMYGKDRILFAIDDDPRNAEMFKAEGVICLLAPGWARAKKVDEQGDTIERLKAALAHYETEEEILELIR